MIFMAICAFEALKELGLATPGDVAVMGYDDQEIARQLSPSLSTMLLHHREMGGWAVDHLISKWRHREGRDMLGLVSPNRCREQPQLVRISVPPLWLSPPITKAEMTRVPVQPY